jgi:HEAT repeat protein
MKLSFIILVVAFMNGFAHAQEKAIEKSPPIFLEKNQTRSKTEEISEYAHVLINFRVINQNIKDMIALVHTEYPAASRSAAANRLRVSDSTNPLFEELIDDSNPDVRSAAINAVGVRAIVKEKTKVCPMELIHALLDKDKRVRNSANNYFVAFDEFPKESLPLLLKALHHEDNDVQSNVAGVIYHLGDAAKDAVPDLLKELDNKDSMVRHNATVSLWYITHRPELILRTNLEILSIKTSPEPEYSWKPEVVSAYFIKMIGEESPKEVGLALIDLLTDSSPKIRATSARSLGALAKGDKTVRSKLLEIKADEFIKKLLEDPDESVRLDAERALENLK